jgi:hypothetical protein
MLNKIGEKRLSKISRALKTRLPPSRRMAFAVMAILLLTMTTVFAAIYFYYTIKVPTSVETQDIKFVSSGGFVGGISLDSLSQSYSTDGTWATFTVKTLDNATWVSTCALVFNASSTKTAYIQISEIDAAANIQWIKIYVFQANTAAATTTLELLAQGRVSVAGVATTSTNPVASVYVGTCPSWLTPGGFTDKSAPQTSAGWTLDSTTNQNQYFLVVETYGPDASAATTIWVHIYTAQ